MAAFVGYTVPSTRDGGVRYTILRDLRVGGTYGAGFLASVQDGAEAPPGDAPADGPHVFFKMLKPQLSSVVERELDLARRHMALPPHVHVARVLDVIPANARATKAGAPEWVLCGAVVMEMHGGGNLFQRLATPVGPDGAGTGAPRALPEPHARFFFRQLVAAVNHLHAHKMCVLTCPARPRSRACALTAAPARAQLPSRHQARERRAHRLHERHQAD
jgi:serine/threonine protein kinase